MTLLHEPTFKNLLPEAVFQQARVIHKVGNLAVYQMQGVKELHHVCYWLVHTYAPDAPGEGAAWKNQKVPRAELKKLEAQLAEQHEAALQRQQEKDELHQALQSLRQELAA